MRIEHLALWTNQLERLRTFYCRYFGATSGPKYHNPTKNFTSYFLSFKSGARLELMHCPDLVDRSDSPRIGLAHLAFGVGSEQEVDRLTEVLHRAGFPPVDGPRRTGDGYYESSLLDPDGNLVELTV